MQPIIMQDWTTIRGTGTSQQAIQSQADWIYTAPFSDISFYLDVREYSGSVLVAYETCPARDEVLFQAMYTSAAIAAVGNAAPVNILLAATPNIPVSHWTRWKLIGTGTPWDLTFRIMAAGNCVC